MALILDFKGLTKKDIVLAGGKGASLGEMTRAGISVPPGFVILAAAFEKFLAETDLNVEIDSILDSVNHKEIHTIENASEKIKALILQAEMPDNIAIEIQKFFNKLGAKYVAVRSSATAEDSASAAWAGQLESYLNTTEENLLGNVKKCWASLFTPRAIFYRFEKDLHKQKISVAVVVQKMVESEKSGIAFSVHPVTQDRNQLIIEAGFELGEAIVSGQITPDSYVVEKQPRRIIDKNIQAQKSVLSDKEILELSELILKIEKHFGFPCDIEWAFERGKIFIVQSRPITTLSSRPFVRKFQKFFSREIPLVVMEYWHRGEYKELYKILNRTTHFNPLFIRNLNQLTDVYYDMNNPDTALQPLFDYFKDNDDKFNLLVEEFEIKQKYISGLLNNFEIKSFSKLFDAIAEAWGYLPIWVHFGSTDNKSIRANIVETSYKLRDKFQEIEYKAGEILLSAIKDKYPKLKEYSDVISAQEVVSNKTPDLTELKERKYSFIFFEGQILTKISKGEFVKKYQVVLVDDLATIGEDNLNNESKADNEDVELVRGRVAYPGFAKGRVRIVMSKSQLDTIQDGEILVTNMTTPEFVPALKKVVAFITDEGGITSHAAIVAREMKKPCIIGTKNATKKLKSGDEVEVDANAGVVTILKQIQQS